jgi:predicted lipoprotein with Yx(FWY)xxD motif
MKKPFRFFLLGSMALSLSLFIGACNDDDPVTPPPTPNLVQAAQTANLTTLLEAVGAVDGLANTLLQEQEITVFAPTNAAFDDALEAFSAGSLEELVAAIGGEENLELVLGYHVVPQVFRAASIPQGQTTLETLVGRSLTVNNANGQITLTDESGNTANVTVADVTIENGVVHLISAVLLPEIELPAPTLTLQEDAEFGKIFTDSNGNVLYFFATDVNGNNNCTGGYANNWPIFFAERESISIDDPDFDAELLGEIQTPNGMQTTYNGWPLYYFVNDNAPGDTNGDGVANVWYVAKPDYDLMVANGQLVGNDGNNYIINDEGAYVEGTGNTRYFVDFNGRTLYRFVNDTFNQSNFGGSENVWPRFRAGVAVVPSAMEVSEFAVIEDGQISFRGNPLYFFGSDAERGETRGVSVPNLGVWPIVNGNTPVLADEG